MTTMIKIYKVWRTARGAIMTATEALPGQPCYELRCPADVPKNETHWIGDDEVHETPEAAIQAFCLQQRAVNAQLRRNIQRGSLLIDEALALLPEPSHDLDAAILRSSTGPYSRGDPGRAPRERDDKFKVPGPRGR